MKKIIEISAMGLAIAALASSCAKEMNTVSSEETETLSITATLGEEQDGGKTVLNNGLANVCFISSDKLFVFGDNAGAIEGKQFSPNKATKNGRSASKVFECETWPAGATPLYAVATTDPAGNACTTGHITLNVSNVAQKLDWSKSYAAHTCTHVGKVEGSEVKQLKNVCALIGFTLSDKKNDIVSIKVTHSGSDASHFGGLVKVDCTADDPVPTVESYVTPTDEIMVTVADVFDNKTYESDNIPVNTQFYLSVLPGEYHDVKFTMVDSQGWVATRTFSRIKLARSTVSDLPTALNCDKDGNVLTFIDPSIVPMPDELTFHIGKDKWYFAENCDATEDPGDYTYKYVDGSGYAGDFTFTFGGGYALTKDSFNLTKNGSYVILPAIEGRTLKSVSIKIRNSSAKPFSVTTLSGENLGGCDAPKLSDDSYGVVEFSNIPGKTAPVASNTSYKIVAGQSGFYCLDICVVYVKNLPRPESITIGFAAKDGRLSGCRSAKGDSSEYTFKMDGYDFIAKSGDWYSISTTGNLYCAEPGYLQLPAFEGYKLVSAAAGINAAKGKSVSFTSDMDKTKIEGGGTQKAGSGEGLGDADWNFTGTTANTVYYLYQESSSTQFTKLSFVYQRVD